MNEELELQIEHEFERIFGKPLNRASLTQIKELHHLRNRLLDYVELAIPKYIKGMKEHGEGFTEKIKDRAWVRKQRQEEMIDLWMYEEAQ